MDIVDGYTGVFAFCEMCTVDVTNFSKRSKFRKWQDIYEIKATTKYNWFTAPGNYKNKVSLIAKGTTNQQCSHPGPYDSLSF